MGSSTSRVVQSSNLPYDPRVLPKVRNSDIELEYLDSQAHVGFGPITMRLELVYLA